jgi:hypothetical protein
MKRGPMSVNERFTLAIFMIILSASPAIYAKNTVDPFFMAFFVILSATLFVFSKGE